MSGTSSISPELQASLKKYNAFWASPAMRVVSLASRAAQFYHGYKRNDSVWWGLGWSLVPMIIGVPLALAQGFGQRKGK